MYVTFHGAIGASLALAAFPENVPAAFFLGWLSHYLADVIPHGDEIDESRYADDRSAYLRRMLAWGGTDLVMLSGLGVAWVWLYGWNWAVFLGAFGAILPDLLWGSEALLGRKFLGPFGRLHSAVHNPLKVRLPLWFGLLYQIIGAGLLWWWLLSR